MKCTNYNVKVSAGYTTLKFTFRTMEEAGIFIENTHKAFIPDENIDKLHFEVEMEDIS